MNWKFWQKGNDNLGLPDFNSASSSDPFASPPSTPGGLDFTQHFESPSAPSLPPMSQSGNAFGGANTNAFAPSAFSQADSPGPGYRPVDDSPSSSAGGAASNDLVLAKLDTIRAQMETINARLPLIEQRLASIEQRLPMTVDASTGNARRPWY